MKKNHIIENNSNEIFAEIDDIIFQDSCNDLSKGHFDFLSGGLGAALYFLKKEQIHYKKSREYIHLIHRLISKDKNLHTVCFNGGTQASNLGLSHGVPSIISFLLQSAKQNIEQDLCIHLMNSFINLMILAIKDRTSSSTYFSYSMDQSTPTRLAWCYGDLSNGYILYHAACFINNSDLRNLAIDILLDTTKRVKIKDTMIYDACICHGEIGVAHIYCLLYNQTGILQFKQASDFWFIKAIESGTHSEGSIAGYKFYRNGNYVPVRGLLEGISGVGLSFITDLFGVNLSWDECLMLPKAL